MKWLRRIAFAAAALLVAALGGGFALDRVYPPDLAR
jgi:hypothetical protein